ncbi:hypothetical protein ACFL2T_07835 [Elusimicrobiota bacterium]
MNYWVWEDEGPRGPHCAGEIVWRRRGDLEVLVCTGAAPSLERRDWRPAWLFPEIRSWRSCLPARSSSLVPAAVAWPRS